MIVGNGLWDWVELNRPGRIVVDAHHQMVLPENLWYSILRIWRSRGFGGVVDGFSLGDLAGVQPPTRNGMNDGC